VTAGLLDVMDALADQIRNVVDDVTDVDVQVEPRLVLNPTPPTIDIYPGDLARDAESAAFDEVSGGYLLTVRARVSTSDNTAGQDLLLAFMDDQDGLSIGQAIMDDKTLNGYAASTDVQSQTGYVLFPDPGGEGALLGCQWSVIVIPGVS
jgi:hypothetical protein